MAGDTDDWKSSTSIEPRSYGWVSWACGCDTRQAYRPNVSSYCNAKCPVCREKDKPKKKDAR